MAAIDSNSRHPLEEIAVNQIYQYLQRCGWPFDRLEVTVSFQPFPRDFVKTKIEAECDEDDRIHGQAKLGLNYLCLQQAPMAFLYDCVPHGCAHLLTECEAIRNGEEVKKHGDEWKYWLGRLSHQAMPRAAGPGHELFDYRPIRLYMGGTLFKCRCQEPNHLHVASARSEKTMRDNPCDGCGDFPRKVSRDHLPPNLQLQYEYISDEQSRREP